MNAYKSRVKRSAIKPKLQPRMAKAVIKLVDRKIHANEENKYFDLSQVIAAGTVATNNAGSIVLLSGIQQGQTFATRIGEIVSPQSIEFRFDTTAFQTQSLISSNLRVIIFQDRQIRTSTLPTVADVLETVVFNSPLNHINVNSKRFNILMDKVMTLDPNTFNPGSGVALAVWTTQTSQRMTKRIRLSGKIYYTNATTGTERNNMYILYLSDQFAATSPSVNCYSRLIFEDA